MVINFRRSRFVASRVLSSHQRLGLPVLLVPLTIPSMKSFSNPSARSLSHVQIKESLSLSALTSNDNYDMPPPTSAHTDDLVLLAVHGTRSSLLQHQYSKVLTPSHGRTDSCSTSKPRNRIALPGRRSSARTRLAFVDVFRSLSLILEGYNPYMLEGYFAIRIASRLAKINKVMGIETFYF